MELSAVWLDRESIGFSSVVVSLLISWVELIGTSSEVLLISSFYVILSRLPSDVIFNGTLITEV